MTTDKGIYVKFDEETIDKMIEFPDICELYLKAAKRAFMRLDGRMAPMKEHNKKEGQE